MSEVRQVRTAEIKLIKYDQPAANIRYTGRSDSIRASDSDPVWQIELEVRNGVSSYSTYALMGEFKCRWDQRTTYFTPPTPDPNSPLGEQSVSGSFAPSGLHVAGKITIVNVDNLTWTPLPVVPLTARNAMSIQNRSGQEVKLQFDNTTVGYTGLVLPNNGERFYDITDNILIFCKSQTSACSIVVEELS